MLRIDNLHTHYGQIEALKGISLHVEQGEIVTLIGANGAGKSTLLNTICGSPQASSGTITYEEQDITTQPTHLISQSGIALVPEGRRVFSGLTVEENLELGGFHQSASDNRQQMRHVYDLFPRLNERRKQRAGTLSGGEQQMLAIGRGLMMRPRLLLLDEPSLGLAPLIIKQIFTIIEDIRAAGITIFLVEQNAHRALQIADRGYVLEIGNIILSDSGANLLTSERVKAAYLGG
ncbi:ABC transporter ATP-binding protein [Suttonella sp. R2A3]|uniref:ABC transporter ATP-binding protein n=1 Tax=Suttonella sp. R2A3 TaxID=2908648 RepID=UPI001F218594|nr:ABC transporter ATP-binding protein [Suttonella sp. R2A3]UJF24371.1 ABC transporter ATP-binding protein [Suttonella sp. R2A3]